MIKRFLFYIRKNGLWKTLEAIVNTLEIRMKILLSMFTLDYWIEARRMSLSNKLARQLNYTVKYGVFKGLKLRRLGSWGGGMFLGLYEKEVLKILNSLHKNYDVLINLGAADGYYGVGCLVAKYFKKSYCFDIDNKRKENLRYNALLNKVSGRVKIFGEVPQDFPRMLRNMGVNLAKSLVISDIEGNEFKILNERVLREMKHSVFIIEIHDYVDNGIVEYQNLQKRASKYFRINKIKTGTRNLSFPELSKMSENNGWLISSEGRHWLTDFLVLIPK